MGPGSAGGRSSPGAQGRGEHPPGRSRWLRPAQAAGQGGVDGSRERDHVASMTVAFGQTSHQTSFASEKRLLSGSSRCRAEGARGWVAFGFVWKRERHLFSVKR